MRILLIGNPVSGRGKTADVVEKIVARARDRGHDIVVEFTTSSASARQLGGAISPGLDCLMIAGGDGTINDVINGADLNVLPPIMAIPTGTANILARELSLPKTACKIIEVVERGNTKNIGLGVVNHKRFLMLVSCGFDALVTKQISHNRPKRLGFRGYFRPILKSLREYVAPEITVDLDSNRQFNGNLVIVLRINKYGGIFEFSSNASLTSDAFEVCVFQRGSLVNIMKYGLIGLLRLARFSSDIQVFTARTVRIQASPESPVEVDGDYFCESPVNIGLMNQIVKVFTP